MLNLRENPEIFLHRCRTTVRDAVLRPGAPTPGHGTGRGSPAHFSSPSEILVLQSSLVRRAPCSARWGAGIILCHAPAGPNISTVRSLGPGNHLIQALGPSNTILSVLQLARVPFARLPLAFQLWLGLVHRDFSWLRHSPWSHCLTWGAGLSLRRGASSGSRIRHSASIYLA